ncbi:hypothetical protein Tco_0822686 [Tanacetum coccineum]|uniref:Uncharacterized protein n=1 Tax=Tanacetum coccineum TaxID=301880 RepID=A0ABQ5AID1_9ASTR
MNYNTLLTHSIHSGTVIDWAFLSKQGLERELACEVFARFEFRAFTSRTNPKHVGIRFRLRGEQRENHRSDIGWRTDVPVERVRWTWWPRLETWWPSLRGVGAARCLEDGHERCQGEVRARFGKGDKEGSFS